MLVSAHAATAAAQHGVTPAHVGSNATLSTRTSPRATPSLLPLSTVLIAHVCCVGARSTRFSSPHPSHAATMTLPATWLLAMKSHVLSLLIDDMPLINPRMRQRFFAILAFLHPPRLTLNQVLWSHKSPGRLMLGGGGEKGSGAVGRAKV